MALLGTAAFVVMLAYLLLFRQCAVVVWALRP
jgi:hypothetical protein